VVGDGGEQLVGARDPLAELVALVTAQRRQLVLARALGVDARQLAEQAGQRRAQLAAAQPGQGEAEQEQERQAAGEQEARGGEEALRLVAAVEGEGQLAAGLLARRRAAQVQGERLRRAELRARAGGESFRAAPRAAARSLKKQYQARSVPTWERDGPLVYSGGQLVFVPGLGLDARVVGLPGQPLVSLSWERKSGG